MRATPLLHSGKGKAISYWLFVWLTIGLLLAVAGTASSEPGPQPATGPEDVPSLWVHDDNDSIIVDSGTLEDGVPPFYDGIEVWTLPEPIADDWLGCPQLAPRDDWMRGGVGPTEPAAKKPMEWNIDRPGSDFRNFDLPSADPKLCQDACERDPRCKAWTYVKPNTIQGSKPRCWLKDSVPAPGQNTSCISGVKGQKGLIRPGAEGAITGDRAPFRTQNYDVVGSSNKFGKDNKDDWMFAITLRAEGTIEWIEVRNTDGQFSLWDTRPETGNWALGVTRYDKTVLNKRDGSVRFNVSGRTDLYLLAADNGSLQAGKTNYKVRIKFVNGRILERNVGRGSGQPPETGGTQQQVTNSRCDQYARTAVAQNQENTRRRCGYKGARWSNNYQGHYDWCVRVSKAFADSETKAREDGLKKCRGEQGQPPPSQAPVTLWPDVDFVTSLYRTILDREPDAGGLQNWVEWLRKGRSREWVITQFFSSREYQSRRKSNREFVRDLYQAVLGREPDAGGWNNWVNSLQGGMSRQDCLNRFFQSAEYNNIRRLGPPGVTQATGAEVDWNNRPWLDPRVIRCVREYLDKVLIMINQEQMRKSEPPFTLLDDWGRLLRPPQITAQGGVDGDWDNPTHFVWGAYNTIKHRNSLLGGVQDYVKDCVRRGGGGPGPGPPGPQPQPGTNPWETPEGRACFEQWIREATAKMNAYNGSDDYNARKPWRINRYGILEGNPKYGPTSAYAPDNWSQYNGNRYWYMWDYWHAPSGVWGKPDLNAAGVPHIRPYILRCIAGYQQAQPPPQPPPQQALLTARYTGIDRDVVGRGGQATPNGEVDGQFSLRLDTRGFRRVVNFIMLQSANAQGQPTGGQVWDTTPNQYWILGVYRNGRRLNPRDQNISDVVQGIVNYQIYGNDSGWFRPGQNLRVTVRFADGGESVAYAKVTGTRPLAGVKPVPTARDDEESPFDDNYQQFIQTQTTRDETRTAWIQEQIAADMASSYVRDEEDFGSQLSDRLDDVHPDKPDSESTEDHAHTTTDQGTESQDKPSTGAGEPAGPSGGQGGTSTPESKCETVALNPGSWRQLQYHKGLIRSGEGGLILQGDEWTNGKIKNGKMDGNGVESAKVFDDLDQGGDIYLTFKVEGGGKFLGIFPRIFSEAGYKLLTTHHSWTGSIVVPDNTPLYAHFKVDPDGKYKTTVCKGNYDDKGGSSISQYSGKLKKKTGRVRIRFVDNYAGEKAYLVILKAEVCIPPKTAVAAAPPEPTKPPTQIGCDTTTKQGGNKPETFIVELGQKSGTFVFKYDMYKVPDRMLVEYEGKKLFDTGCVGNRQGAGRGVGSRSITYSGSSTKVTVKVLPSCEGGNTKWTFTANCPTKPPAKPPTKPPAKPPETTTFKCKSNQDCWSHHKECNWYCKKNTGKCIECKKNQHGKRDGTEDCCAGVKHYPNCGIGIPEAP